VNPTEPPGCGRGEFVEDCHVETECQDDYYAWLDYPIILAGLGLRTLAATALDETNDVSLHESLLPKQGALTSTDMCLLYGSLWLALRGGQVV
jgi:hypothetical protein